MNCIKFVKVNLVGFDELFDVGVEGKKGNWRILFLLLEFDDLNCSY